MEWSASVTLNAVSVTSKIVGRITVEAEESTARIATFTLKPDAGAVDVSQWIGASVVIAFIEDPNGTPTQTTIFTGVVNLPEYDIQTRQVRFNCTDNFQQVMETQTEAQILTAITDGKYSESVFGAREDGWQQFLDVLSTVPKGYDLNKDGVTGVLTAWASPSGGPSHTGADVISGSLQVEIARLRDIVNKIEINYQYRYTRRHHREHQFTWSWDTDFCTYYSNSHELPNRNMIDTAAQSAGWGIQTPIVYGTLPVSGTYCSGQVWVISDELQDQLVTSASWTAVRRWTQTITETWLLTVKDGASITKFGEHLEEDGSGHQAEYDDAQWDSSGDVDTPAWSTNVIGDYVNDELDRADSDNTIETLLGIANTRIRASHRKNYVTYQVALDPSLERSQGASLTSSEVTASGKIHQFVHEMDIDRGTALTTIKIAVSKAGTSGVNDTLAAPTPVSTQPTHGAPSSTTPLPARYGNDDTAPNYDANWVGFTGNYTVAQGTPTAQQIYPRRFRVVTPDIESQSRDAAEFTGDGPNDGTYNVSTPDETLTVVV